MSQPFNRSFSFSNFQSANPSAPIPRSQVDLERFGIPLIRISPRRIAIKRSDFDLLLEKAAS